MSANPAPGFLTAVIDAALNFPFNIEEIQRLRKMKDFIAHMQRDFYRLVDLQTKIALEKAVYRTSASHSMRERAFHQQAINVEEGLLSPTRMLLCLWHENDPDFGFDDIEAFDFERNHQAEIITRITGEYHSEEMFSETIAEKLHRLWENDPELAQSLRVSALHLENLVSRTCRQIQYLQNRGDADNALSAIQDLNKIMVYGVIPVREKLTLPQDRDFAVYIAKGELGQVEESFDRLHRLYFTSQEPSSPYPENNLG